MSCFSKFLSAIVRFLFLEGKLAYFEIFIKISVFRRLKVENRLATTSISLLVKGNQAERWQVSSYFVAGYRNPRILKNNLSLKKCFISMSILS